MLYSVTKDRLFSAEFTMPMLRELCTRYLGMTDDAVTQLANQKLQKGSSTVKALAYAKLRTVALNKMGNGFAQQYPSWEADGAVELDFACLDAQAEAEAAEAGKRAQAEAEAAKRAQAQAEAEAAEQAQAEASGANDGNGAQAGAAPNFGANTRKRGAAGGTAKGPQHTGGVPRKGAYKVGKRPTSASVNGGDAGKWEIWQHVWECHTFEEFFAKAPAKGVTSATGRQITASGSMNWALKSGWIVPVEPA